MCTMGHLAVSLAPGVFSTCSLAVTTKSVCRLQNTSWKKNHPVSWYLQNQNFKSNQFKGGVGGEKMSQSWSCKGKRGRSFEHELFFNKYGLNGCKHSQSSVSLVGSLVHSGIYLCSYLFVKQCSICTEFTQISCILYVISHLLTRVMPTVIQMLFEEAEELPFSC